MIRPTTTPPQSTSKSSSFHSPDGREIEARLRSQIVLVHFTEPTCAAYLETRSENPFGISDAPVSSILVRRAHGNSCVDGPRLARENITCRTEVACSHVSALFTQSLNDPNHSFTGHPFDTCR